MLSINPSQTGINDHTSKNYNLNKIIEKHKVSHGEEIILIAAVPTSCKLSKEREELTEWIQQGQGYLPLQCTTTQSTIEPL